MKRLFTQLLLTFVAVSSLQAQQMRKINQMQEFDKRLSQETQTLQSIESDFSQTKYLDVLDEKVKSKGKFYYKKSNKIRMEYTSPINYLIVINGGKLKVVSDGKKNIMNVNSNKMMSEVQNMLTACTVGDLSKMSANYRLEYFEDAKSYLVKIKPISKTIQAYIASIQIYLDKKDMSVYKMILSETATNYTEYEFYNKKFNSLKNEAMFAIH
ncbi:LolA family protein [Bacteroides ihuae]|uniref:LolA family protein n=1 Tax=Bacteroides ihuae TaxID=1852362 RepID=UPI0008DA4963|nr:outer membrane lipoprotein carrier protein LolA [Bacteroides ihuae]